MMGRITQQAYEIPIYLSEGLTYVGPKVKGVTYNRLGFSDPYAWSPK
jgi:hypothetical protein